MWLITKDKKTGELGLVNRFQREVQIQVWVLNGITVPSIVLRQYSTPEEASDFLIEIQEISDQINKILEKDEEKFGNDLKL